MQPLLNRRSAVVRASFLKLYRYPGDEAEAVLPTMRRTASTPRDVLRLDLLRSIPSFGLGPIVPKGCRRSDCDWYLPFDRTGPQYRCLESIKPKTDSGNKFWVLNKKISSLVAIRQSRSGPWEPQDLNDQEMIRIDLTQTLISLYFSLYTFER